MGKDFRGQEGNDTEMERQIFDLKNVRWAIFKKTQRGL